jgi:hypothetical protein
VQQSVVPSVHIGDFTRCEPLLNVLYTVSDF